MGRETVRLLGIGDNVSDQYVHTNTMYPGGQALNVAVFARMQGAEAGFLGAFGNDAAAEHIGFLAVCLPDFQLLQTPAPDVQRHLVVPHG